MDDDFLAEVNNVCINGALKQLSADCPEAFIPDQETIFLLADQTSDTLSRTVAATSDPYVLDLGLVGANENILTNGTWDGVYHIEVTLADGSVVRRQCREFWSASYEVPVPGPLHYYVSLDRQWRTAPAGTVDTALSFRLHQPYFYVRDNVAEVVDGRIFNSTRQTLQILPAGWTRTTSWEDYQGQGSGQPEAIARWGFYQIPAPNRTPTVATGAGSWDGPEPIGTFKYRYTYVWGKKDFEVASPRGVYEPMWESAPSPASAAAVVPDVTSTPTVSLVNIDHVMNFDPVPIAMRNGHSGLRKRIYRARTAVASGGGLETQVEYPDVYFLLAEVDGDATTYEDKGTEVPDYFRRLPESRGYFSWSAVPHQNGAYEIDLRVYRRPLALLDDNDAPPLQPDFDDMLEDLVLARLCEIDKSPEAALGYLTSYKGRLEQYRASKANPADFIPPAPWRPDHSYTDPYRYLPFRSTSR